MTLREVHMHARPTVSCKVVIFLCLLSGTARQIAIGTPQSIYNKRRCTDSMSILSVPQTFPTNLKSTSGSRPDS